MPKPTALYYRVLQYQPENLKLLQQHFEIIELEDPRNDTNAILAKTEILFAPLGFHVDAEKISRCPNLRAIVSNTTGIPHIDVEAAGSRNIAVCALHDEQAFLDTITPTVEHTIGLMLAAWRRVPWAHQSAASGIWNRRPWGAPAMFSRLRLGLVGFGRIGSKVGRIAEAMGMDVAYFDPYVDGGVDSLLTLAQRSDIFSLHAPANDETSDIVSRAILEALPKGSMLINTARGELLDEAALLDLLESGHIQAAALDTLKGEYHPDFADTFQTSRIAKHARDHENLVLTPHIGGSSIDAWSETEACVINKAIHSLETKET